MDDQTRLIKIIREIADGNYSNGKGYPRGLSAEKIPTGARILSVTDCFDAITTDRAYQKGKSPAEAFEILERLGKKQLDSGLVNLFIAEIRENGMEHVTSLAP